MYRLGFDLETHTFGRANMAPRIVAGVWCESTGRMPTRVTDREATRGMLAGLTCYDTLVGHNIAYDMACVCSNYPDLIPRVLKMYANGQIWDTMLGQQLVDHATGKYDSQQGKAQHGKGWSLGVTAERHGCSKDKDPEGWRMRFAELDGVPVPEWPKSATDYILQDGKTPIIIMDALTHKARGTTILDSMPHRTRVAFSLQLISCWGFHSDRQAVEKLRVKTDEELSVLAKEMWAKNLLKKGPKGASLNTILAKDAMWAAVRADVCPPTWTDKGKDEIKALGDGADWRAATRPMKKAELGRHVKANRPPDVRSLKAADRVHIEKTAPRVPLMRDFLKINEDTSEASKDPNLVLYAKYSKVSRSIPRLDDLSQGYEYPLQPSYDSLKATGRTSSRKPMAPVMGIQAQNFGREGGFRECVVPRPGCVFISADYSSMEMHTLAQSCIHLFGQSKIADLLNDGVDLHWYFAAMLLGVSYEDAKKHPEGKSYRQQAKAANYGFPGGMGIDTFRLTYHDLGLSANQAKALKASWLQMDPAIAKYFRYVGDLTNNPTERVRVLKHPGSTHIRGNVTYSSACNSMFQHLGANMATDALWRVTRSCFTPESDLYHTRVVNFAHDEIFTETPEHLLTPAAKLIEKHMYESSLTWVPDVPCRAPAAAMRRWTKAAEPVWDGEELKVWEQTA